MDSLDGKAQQRILTTLSLHFHRYDSPEDLVAQFRYLRYRSILESRFSIESMLHSSIVKHPPAMDSFLRFSFKTLQNRWYDYLTDTSDPHSFTITRQQRSRGELSDLRILKAIAPHAPLHFNRIH